MTVQEKAPVALAIVEEYRHLARIVKLEEQEKKEAKAAALLLETAE